MIDNFKGSFNSFIDFIDVDETSIAVAAEEAEREEREKYKKVVVFQKYVKLLVEHGMPKQKAVDMVAKEVSKIESEPYEDYYVTRFGRLIAEALADGSVDIGDKSAAEKLIEQLTRKDVSKWQAEHVASKVLHEDEPKKSSEASELEEFSNKIARALDRAEPELDGAARSMVKEIAKMEISEEDIANSGIKVNRPTNTQKIARMIMEIQSSYDKLSEEHPLLTEAAFTTFSLALNTIVGGGYYGLVNGIRGEITGRAIGALAGEEIEEKIRDGLDIAAKAIRTASPELSEQEAYAFASAGVFVAVNAADGSAAGKLVLKQVKLKVDLLDSVQKVGSHFPRNAAYAGKTFHMSEVSDAIKQKHPNLHVDYPNGVKFDEKGFPRFEPYAIKEVEIKLTGKHSKDVEAANRIAGYTDTPKGYLWHHHEDAKTMQLVPTHLHNAVAHTGGVATNKHNHKVK